MAEQTADNVEEIFKNSHQHQQSITLWTQWLANPLTKALIDVVREAILIVDGDLRVIFASRAAREIFVFPPITSPRIVDITRNREIYQCFTDAFKDRKLTSRNIELIGGISARSTRNLELRVESIICEETNEVIGAIGAFFDNTRMEALERVRREFFANLSHELRTPLTSIQTYVETLLSGALYDKENNIKFLKIIAKHASRMQNLAQDISDLAAIESGKVTLNAQPIKLAHLVREVGELLKDSLTSRHVTLRIEIDEAMTIITDLKGLEQILFNLIQNGIHFNKSNGSVIVTAHTDELHHVITVRDTGIGMDMKHIPRIFERLYRVDASRSRKEGGTGLGLAIVKHLIQALKGSIKVESVPNQGTTFTLFLPLPQDNY